MTTRQKMYSFQAWMKAKIEVATSPGAVAVLELEVGDPPKL